MTVLAEQLHSLQAFYRVVAASSGQNRLGLARRSGQGETIAAIQFMQIGIGSPEAPCRQQHGNANGANRNQTSIQQRIRHYRSNELLS
jgi:hypothetical protein